MDQETSVADSGQVAEDTSGFDIDQASSDLAGDLFPASEREASDDVETATEQDEPTQDGGDTGQADKPLATGDESDCAL